MVWHYQTFTLNPRDSSAHFYLSRALPLSSYLTYLTFLKWHRCMLFLWTFQKQFSPRQCPRTQLQADRRKLGVSHVRGTWTTDWRALAGVIHSASQLLFLCTSHKSSKLLKTAGHGKGLDTYYVHRKWLSQNVLVSGSFTRSWSLTTWLPWPGFLCPTCSCPLIRYWW